MVRKITNLIVFDKYFNLVAIIVDGNAKDKAIC